MPLQNLEYLNLDCTKKKRHKKYIILKGMSVIDLTIHWEEVILKIGDLVDTRSCFREGSKR